MHVYEAVSALIAGANPEADVVVIGLTLPFGWTGDPYSTPFFCFDWVDDHVLVERDTGDRLQACDSAIRLPCWTRGPQTTNVQQIVHQIGRSRVGMGLSGDVSVDAGGQDSKDTSSRPGHAVINYNDANRANKAAGDSTTRLFVHPINKVGGRRRVSGCV
ncbi:hypothetical protein ON010_g18449 [Phytophthora cinnamomi]|nr:hypothetical protein ON010_g18449 [Phytophthora cinnamomi]